MSVEYHLTLFVSGATGLSARAIADTKRLCEVHLACRYHLAVVDINDDRAAVEASRVHAAPTLIRDSPLPVSRVVGDLSNTEEVARSLGIK